MGTIGDKLAYLKQTKEEIKNSIVNAGEKVSDTDTFRDYAVKINKDIRYNLYLQATAPTTKEGFWFKTSNQIEVENVVVKNNFRNLIENKEWKGSAEYAQIPYTIFLAWECDIVGDWVYIFGSEAGDNVYSACRYNYKTNTSETLPNSPVPTHRGHVSAVGTNVYILGGNDNNSIYKYDTLTETYTEMKTLPQRFILGSSIAVGTDIYIIGGYTYGSNWTQQQCIYKYDTVNNSITQLKNIPYGFAYGRTVYYNGDIYLIGSLYNAKALFKYNIATNSYTQLANLPFDFQLGCAEIVEKDIYIFVGKNACIYHIDTNTYEMLSTLPYDIAHYPSAVVFKDNAYKILVFGADNNQVGIVSYDTNLQTFENNSLVIFTDTLDKSTQFYGDVNLEGKLPTHFEDVTLYANGLYINTEKYYGNNESWVKI